MFWILWDPVRTMVLLVALFGTFVLIVVDDVAQASWNPIRLIKDRVEFGPWVTIMLTLWLAWLGLFVWSTQVAPVLRLLGDGTAYGEGVEALVIMLFCLVIGTGYVFWVPGGRTK
jgi:hypothetical protein